MRRTARGDPKREEREEKTLTHPIDAINGFFSASAASSPSAVVSTRIASSAAPMGFSANSTMRPESSTFMRPKSEARSRSTGRAPIVMSAPVARWCSTNLR